MTKRNRCLKLAFCILLTVSVWRYESGSVCAASGISGDHLTQSRNYLETLGKRYSNRDLEILTRLNLSGLALSDQGLEYLIPLKSLKRLLLKNTAITGSGLRHLQNSATLEYLNLQGSAIQADQLYRLAAFTPLKVLNLSGVELDNQHLAFLAQLKNLKELNLSHTRLSDEGLRFINELPALEVLHLSDTRITDSGLHNLDLPHLQTLDLSSTSISGAGLEQMPNPRKLKKLNLANTMMSDDAVAFIADWNTLEQVILSDTHISDSAATHLKSLERLIFLDLANTRITSSSFPLFQQLQSLRALAIDGTHISYAEVQTLKELLPQVDTFTNYVIATAHEGMSTEDSPSVETRHSNTDAVGEIRIEQPLVVGLASPFVIVFPQAQHQEQAGKPFTADLVFELDSTPFTVFFGNCSRFGRSTVTLPNHEIIYDDGVIRGKISVERLTRGARVKVFQKDKHGDALQFIAESRVDRFYTDVAGIKFSQRFLKGSTGDEFEIELFPYDYLGNRTPHGISDRMLFFVYGENELIIDGRKIDDRFELGSGRFKNGRAAIKVKAEKEGRYILSYNREERYDPENTGFMNDWVSLEITTPN